MADSSVEEEPCMTHLSMTAREELRRHRRQELKCRYENTRKRREDQAKAKLEVEKRLEKLQRKAQLEQKLEVARQHHQREIQKQRRRELWVQEMELASLHNHRRIILRYGLFPWRLHILQKRLRFEESSQQFLRLLTKRILLSWMEALHDRKEDAARTVLRFRAKWSQQSIWHMWKKHFEAKQHYLITVSFKAFYSFVEAVHCCKNAVQKALNANKRQLYRRSWKSWRVFLKEMQNEMCVKSWVASLYAQRMALVHAFNVWKAFLEEESMEKLHTRKKLETWTKIEGWLAEYQQDKLQHHG